MRSCIRVFYIALLAASAALQAQQDPDQLYRGRADVARAREAAAIWEARLAADPRDFESAWKAARAMYWIGGHDTPPVLIAPVHLDWEPEDLEFKQMAQARLARR